VNKLNNVNVFLVIHLHARFLSREGRGGNSPRRRGIPHSQQQFHIVLLAPREDETKQGRRCSYATQALSDLWAAFPWI